MIDYGQQFSFTFTLAPLRQKEFYNAWSSSLELNDFPTDVYLFFNPFSQVSHDIFLDMADVRSECIIFKMKRYTPIAFCWNLSMMLSKTPYIIHFNDDVVFQDPDLLKKVYEKHQEGHALIQTTENFSGFSMDIRKLLDTVGWFDPGCVWSFEDVDYKYRMIRANIEPYKFEPHLVKHLRVETGRDEQLWDKSSEYFFKKWDIATLLNPNCPALFENALSRRNLQARGFFRNVDPNILKPVLPSPVFPRGQF